MACGWDADGVTAFRSAQCFRHICVRRLDADIVSGMPQSFVLRAAAAGGAIAALLLPACRGTANAPPQTSAVPAGPRIFVSDETGTEVVVVDPEARQVVQRIAIGKRPRGVKLSPDGAQLFVALSGSPIGGPGVDESKLPPADRAADGIGVIDVATHAVVKKYKSGQDPESFAVSTDGKMLFVSNEDEGALSILDLQSGEVKQKVKVGEEPEGVTVRPDGKAVYVTSEGDGIVTAVDTATLKVIGQVKTGPRPRSIAFTRDGATGFVTCENAGVLTVFDAATNALKTTIQLPKIEGAPTAPRPMGQAVSPDGARLFVSLGRAKAIAVVDTAALTVVGTMADVGARPWGIAVSPDGRKLYTANGPSGDVSVVDVQSGKVEARIKVGGSPWGVAVASTK
jgi:YVTN family beta-propeller protein